MKHIAFGFCSGLIVCVLSTATARGPSGMAIPSRVSTLASDSSRYGLISKTLGATSMTRSGATRFLSIFNPFFKTSAPPRTTMRIASLRRVTHWNNASLEQGETPW